MSERRGHWMETVSGRQFWPLDPRSDEVDLFDIAGSLSKICRFNGHTRAFYSVAQHCVLVSRAVEPQSLAMYGLFHDAAEAYCQDLIRPIKHSEPFARYAYIERQIANCIAQRFGFALGFSESREVKNADNRVLLAEKRDLMSSTEWTVDWAPNVTPWPEPIVALDPDHAQQAFLDRYQELRGRA